jgi:hypothetical protein
MSRSKPGSDRLQRLGLAHLRERRYPYGDRGEDRGKSI